ncbi:MAG TPA: HYR domain-containing protein [Phycisphaerae bacterium]|nr:HYR domain-containing protein [Phycisphaerae bacterium]HRW54199.1 HYR domain-containing protein [Phycisphaerae bacterium]
MRDFIDSTFAGRPSSRIGIRLAVVIALWRLTGGAAIAQADIPGACCFPDGTCEAYVNSVACAEDGGAFAGFGVTCDNAACPAPVCDETLELSACPQRIIFETTDENGVVFDLPTPPTATGCDPIVTLEPAIGDLLPVGETIVVVTAEDDLGDVVSCAFTVVVSRVAETGPIQKRRIKGGGLDGAESIGGCGLGAPTEMFCGACPMAGFAGVFAALATCRRRRRACRKSR